MKKSMRAALAARLVEALKKGTITVDREGMVMQVVKTPTGKTKDGKVLKQKLSKYILKRMVREGAQLKATGYYEAE